MMLRCPHCGGPLLLDNADPDGEVYFRCLCCARPVGMAARSLVKSCKGYAGLLRATKNTRQSTAVGPARKGQPG
jgi:hypothetical protein